MSQEPITARDLFKQVPGLLKRLPKILRGYYYYVQRDPDSPLTLGYLIEKTARRHGDRPALLYEDLSISYTELNAWANRYAHFFQAQGLAKGDRIAIFLENRPELLAVFIGAAKLGVACGFINTSQRGQVLAHSINLLEARMLLVGEERLEAVTEIQPDLAASHPMDCLFIADRDSRVDHGEAPAGFANAAALASHYPDSNPSPADPPHMGDTAFFLFTSGTTGLPKAAPGSHRKFVKAYGGFGLMSLGMTPTDVIYVPLPFYHGTALLVCWGSAVAGASALVMRRRFSASSFWDDIRRYNATTFGYVGELCRYLLQQPASPRDRDHPLRKMIGNGLRPSIWKPFKDRFGIDQVVELYASSEGNIGFSNFLNLDNTVGISTASHALVRFHQGTRDPVRNSQGWLEEVAVGQPGLLVGEITPKWPFEGYTQQDGTDSAVIRGAFSEKDAWFNTGDVLRNIGYGHLQFVDRMGDTFRWKGENVSTLEVENVIDGFTGVAEVVVYGVNVPGANGKAGMATLVPTEYPDFDVAGFYAYLKDHLPGYAVPVFLRITPAIEKTGTFKYRKQDLKDLGYQQGPPADLVYAALPGAGGYVLLDGAAVEALDRGEFKL